MVLIERLFTFNGLNKLREEQVVLQNYSLFWEDG